MAGPRYEAVLFDLLTALLDSWSLWNRVAGSAARGLAWRTRYLELTYRAGRYRPYEEIIADAARDADVPAAAVETLVGQWVTNSSVALADIAVAALGVPMRPVVTAESAGYYKPRPEPYRMALERLGCDPASVLFVAGSAADVPGASAVGMPVYWHNRRGLPSIGGSAPTYVADSLDPIVDLVRTGQG
jgi:2-haloacid dehalogenase